MDAQNVLVHFHIGRGGRFFNPGFKTYVGTVRGLFDCFCEATVVSEDEDGKALPDDKWMLVDSGGHVTLTGREEIESPVGVLDWDGDYDTDIVRYLSECGDEEYQLIIDAYNAGEYVDEKAIDYACTAMDVLRVVSPMYGSAIIVDGDKMTVRTQDGDRVIERNEFGNEGEARSELEWMGFVKKSVDELLQRMECEGWFDED